VVGVIAILVVTKVDELELWGSFAFGEAFHDEVHVFVIADGHIKLLPAMDVWNDDVESGGEVNYRECVGDTITVQGGTVDLYVYRELFGTVDPDL